MRNNNRNDNLASTTVSDMKAVAQDMLRMGRHWTQAAQDWLDQRREEVRDDDRRPRSTRRRTHDTHAGHGSHGDSARPYGAYGARGYRGVGPRNYTRSDERIREDLNERLTEADDLDARDLTVEVNNGIATLTGSVAHRWMKHRAEDIADDCIGVRDVRNQIVVRTASAASSASAGTGSSTAGTASAGSSSAGTGSGGTTSGHPGTTT